MRGIGDPYRRTARADAKLLVIEKIIHFLFKHTSVTHLNSYFLKENLFLPSKQRFEDIWANTSYSEIFTVGLGGK